jgi:hypothetical protein
MVTSHAMNKTHPANGNGTASQRSRIQAAISVADKICGVRDRANMHPKAIRDREEVRKLVRSRSRFCLVIGLVSSLIVFLMAHIDFGMPSFNILVGSLSVFGLLGLISALEEPFYYWKDRRVRRRDELFTALVKANEKEHLRAQIRDRVRSRREYEVNYN